MATKKGTATQRIFKGYDKPKRKAAAVKPATAEPAILQPQEGRTISRKLGITLFINDIKRIGEIAAYMQKQTGELITRSDVIRLGLRGVILDESLIDLYNEFKTEDGRGTIAKAKRGSHDSNGTVKR